MTDAVKVALIDKLPEIITAIFAGSAMILGFINRSKIGNVDTKVDGKMSAMTDKVADLQKLLLDLTSKSSRAEGKLEGSKLEGRGEVQA